MLSLFVVYGSIKCNFFFPDYLPNAKRALPSPLSFRGWFIVPCPYLLLRGLGICDKFKILVNVVVVAVVLSFHASTIITWLCTIMLLRQYIRSRPNVYFRRVKCCLGVVCLLVSSFDSCSANRERERESLFGVCHHCWWDSRWRVLLLCCMKSSSRFGVLLHVRRYLGLLFLCYFHFLGMEKWAASSSFLFWGDLSYLFCLRPRYLLVRLPLWSPFCFLVCFGSSIKGCALLLFGTLRFCMRLHL